MLSCGSESLILNDDSLEVLTDIAITILVLLYADDTILFATSASGMQKNLDNFNEYCLLWKLKVNAEKTKVLIFGGNKKDAALHFEINGKQLETVYEYKYLGIMFHRLNKFSSSKKSQMEQATKAVYFILQKGRCNNLSVQCHLKLFDAMVLPILLYGCEVWGFEDLKCIEKVHIDFLRKLLPLKKSTPSYMIYGELGRKPLYIHVYTRMVSYWADLVLGKP